MVTPTISRKLRTNDPPTSEEAATVRRAMDRPLSKLRAVESEISRLQNRLAALCQEKEDIEHFAEIHERLLSPVRRLHRDILQEIFYQCLPIAHNSVLDPNAAPLVLGRVCSSWRQIAYTTPKLWSSLHIVAIPLLSHQENARLTALSAWLSRSGALPLSISMWASGFSKCCRRRRTPPINSQIHPYMDLILTYIKRWKRIHLSILPYNWTTFLQLVNTVDLPLLEILHLEGRSRNPLSLDISMFSRKRGILFSPLLHVLSLPDYSQRLLELPVQWRQITALNLERRTLPFRDIIKVLSLCSDLQTCSITISTLNPQPTVQTSDVLPIVLPKLRTLKLIVGSSRIDCALTLIDKIVTPQLRHFAYVRSVGVRPCPVFPEFHALEPGQLMSSLCSFFRRLNKPLEEFDYWSNSLTRRGMMEVLSCVPGLKRLSLRDFDVSVFGDADTDPDADADADAFISKRSFNDQFLAQFIPYQYRMQCLSDEEITGKDEEDRFPPFICLCPKLEVLNSVDAVYSERILLEFLRSRSVYHHKYNVSHLRRASITFKDFAEPNTTGLEDITKQIERLGEKTGLVVELRYPLPPGPPILPPLYETSHSGIQTGSVPSSGPNVGFMQFHF